MLTIIKLLGRVSVVDMPPSRRFLLDITQHRIGGFSKSAGGPPDIYHSYLGLASLAIMEDSTLKEFDVALCCSKETTSKIERAREGLFNTERREDTLWDNGFWGSTK